MRLVFMHGWAFDATFWQPLAQRLSGHEAVIDERGYFGPAMTAMADDAPCVVIAHSLGVMRALGDPPAGCRGLVAINGCERFTEGEHAPGIARRILDRMIDRLAEDPADTVTQFRRLCANSDAFGPPNVERLRQDLVLLRDGDCRKAAGKSAFPILALHGATDPIVTQAMRDTAFAGAKDAQSAVHAQGGHLLPTEAPDWCATHIRGFIGALT